MRSRCRRQMRRGLGLSVALAGVVLCATRSTEAAAERFYIRVQRQASGIDIEGARIVKGRLIINGQDLGETVENPSYKLEPGTFEGAIRYVFQRDLLLGSGVHATIGDVFVAIDQAQGSARRVDILFQSGNLSSQSKGSVLLGPALRGSAGDLLLPPSHTLYRMRVALYGSATPAIHPDRLATMKLNQQPVRIGEIQLRRAFLCPATILHPHADVMDQRSRRALGAGSRLDAVTLERLDDGVRVETLHAHAEMVDAGRTRCSVCGGTPAASGAGEHEELHATHAQHGSGRPLVGLNPQPEELLIERVRARCIGHEARAVAPVTNGEQTLLRRRLRRRADLAEDPSSTAVTRVLQLHDEAVGIGEIELRCS
jgi:hypothetical protein